MALPSSFPISASEINVELGRAPTATFNITGAEERALAEVPVGAISFSDFLGKELFGAEFLASYTQAYADPTTFVALDIGAANAERRVFITIHFYGEGSNNNPLTSATIGGIAATVHAQDGNHNGINDQVYRTAIISAVVPTGTTANVVLNWTGATSGSVTIGVIRTKGLVGGIIDSDALHCSGTCTSVNFNVTVPAEGVIIFASTGMCDPTTNVTITSPTPVSYDGANYAGGVVRDQPSGSKNVRSTISGAGCNVNMAVVTWTGL